LASDDKLATVVGHVGSLAENFCMGLACGVILSQTIEHELTKK